MDPLLTVLLDTPAFHKLIANAALYATGTIIGQLLVATPAAWALARFPFPGRRALFAAYILLMMLPFQAVMLPNYLVLEALGINNTAWAIILPGACAAFPVFILRHVFAAIPRNLIDAARIDGAGEVALFLRIGLPLGAPGIFAVVTLGFFEYWNLVEQPLAFLKDQQLWPISLFTPAASPDANAVMIAAALIAAIPGLLVFLWGKDYLEAGLGAAAQRTQGVRETRKVQKTRKVQSARSRESTGKTRKGGKARRRGSVALAALACYALAMTVCAIEAQQRFVERTPVVSTAHLAPADILPAQADSADAVPEAGVTPEAGTDAASKAEADAALGASTPIPYPQCLPVRALRNGGEPLPFVFVVDERPGAFGQETFARKVSVTVVARDDSHVALQEGSLARNQAVIVDATGPLEDGTVVQLEKPAPSG